MSKGLPQGPEIAFAVECVREASVLASRIQRELVFSGLTKDDNSPVTVADFAVQALVSWRLQEHFPGDPLVAEEDAGRLRFPQQAALLARVCGFLEEKLPSPGDEEVCRLIDRGGAQPSGRFWTLDPIDGTKGFLRGQHYAVALALLEEGKVRLAALGCPQLRTLRGEVCPGGILALAVRGEGAFYSGLHDHLWRPLRVSPQTDPARARILRSLEPSHTNEEQLNRVARRLGVEAEPVRMDSQAKTVLLAAGQAELLFRLISPHRPHYKEMIWDQAAGSLLVEEAGGRVTDLDGRPLDFRQGRRLTRNRGVLASNGRLHEAALRALAEVEPGS